MQCDYFEYQHMAGHPTKVTCANPATEVFDEVHYCTEHATYMRLLASEYEAEYGFEHKPGDLS